MFFKAGLQFPVYFLPPALMATVFASTLATNPALSVPITTYLLLVSFGFGLPGAIAVFPQFGTIGVNDVEEQFMGAKGKDGKVLTEFAYNKGL